MIFEISCLFFELAAAMILFRFLKALNVNGHHILSSIKHLRRDELPPTQKIIYGSEITEQLEQFEKYTELKAGMISKLEIHPLELDRIDPDSLVSPLSHALVAERDLISEIERRNNAMSDFDMYRLNLVEALPPQTHLRQMGGGAM